MPPFAASASASKRRIVNADESPLAATMRIQKTRELAKLNIHYQQQLKDVQKRVQQPGTDLCKETMICHYEYRRIVSLLNDRYRLDTGAVYAFGSDDAQQLGQPEHPALPEGQKKTNYGPLLIKTLPRNIRSVSAGGMHSVVLTTDGVPYTWGYSDGDVLGRPVDPNRDDGDEYAISEATPSMVQGFTTSDGRLEHNNIVQAVGGATFCIYLSIAGNVYMNGHYRGDDNAAFRGGPSPIGANERPVVVQLPGKAVTIYSSSSASCCAALLEDGRLLTWGMGLNGQLARSPSMFPPNADGTYDLTRSRSMSEMNGIKTFTEDVLKYVTPSPVQFHILSGPALPVKILSVACGALHMLVVGRPADGNGESYVYAAGDGQAGQLGIHMDGDNMELHELTQVPSYNGKNIMKVAAGELFSLALDLSGQLVYSHGQSDKGMLGRGREVFGKLCHEPKPVKFPAVETSTPRVRHTFRDISAGESSSFAITIDHKLFSWGFGESQATGHAGDVDVWWPRELKIEGLDEILQVTGGAQHTVVLGHR